MEKKGNKQKACKHTQSPTQKIGIGGLAIIYQQQDTNDKEP